MTKEIVPKDGDAPDYGDFLDSDEEVEIEDECEPYEWYFDGKFYRVCLGEVLARRYRVEHKLGRGGSSTVWLAHGMQDRKDVALKIIVEGEAGEYEYQMHEEILRTVRDTSHLVVHQGTFLLPSENGKHHRVLVLPFLGPGLDYRMRDLPLATRVSSAKQLLVALKGLHDVGLVHGDLNRGALMWELTSSFDECDLATKYQRLGSRPRKMYLDLGGDYMKQGEIVEPVKMPLDLYGSKFYLGDFGITFKEGIQREFRFQGVPSYCAPEMLHQIERDLALSVMLKGFCYLPERRITAGQLLQDPSFKALMEMHQC